ncbi:hypothetical protein GCM10022284_27560 [Streptomyces hundungensis]
MFFHSLDARISGCADAEASGPDPPYLAKPNLIYWRPGGTPGRDGVERSGGRRRFSWRRGCGGRAGAGAHTGAP